MRTIIGFLGILIIGILGSFSMLQQRDHSLARVYKTSNKLVFFWNDPVNNYDVAFTFKDTIQNYGCLSLEQGINSYIKAADKIAAAQNKTYDAIIIGTTDIDMAITFSDKTKDNSIARVRRREGKFLFANCDPLDDYDVVAKFKGDEKGEILSSACRTQEERINKLYKKANRLENDFDAIIYGSSSTHDLIVKFK